jgi:hypothetical protein
VSRYDLFRRRIAPIAFALAVGLLAYETCTKQQRTHATIFLQLGDAAPNVKSIAAEVTIGDESFAQYYQATTAGSVIKLPPFEVSLPEQDAQLRIDAEMTTSRKQLTRRIHIEEGAKVTVPLADELREPR